MQDKNKQMLNAREVAEMIGMSISYVRHLTPPELPRVKIGNRVRFRHNDVRHFIEKRLRYKI